MTCANFFKETSAFIEYRADLRHSFIGSYIVHHLVVHQVVNFQNRCKGTTNMCLLSFF